MVAFSLLSRLFLTHVEGPETEPPVALAPIDIEIAIVIRDRGGHRYITREGEKTEQNTEKTEKKKSNEKTTLMEDIQVEAQARVQGRQTALAGLNRKLSFRFGLPMRPRHVFPNHQPSSRCPLRTRRFFPGGLRNTTRNACVSPKKHRLTKLFYCCRPETILCRHNKYPVVQTDVRALFSIPIPAPFGFTISLRGYQVM